MIEQIGNALTFWAFYVASKAGKTGLTVTVDVWKNSVEIVTAGSATEVGDGLYKYTLASGSVDAEGDYIAVFHTTDTSVDQKDLPALWLTQKAGVEHLDENVSAAKTLTAAYDAAKTAAQASVTALEATAQSILEDTGTTLPAQIAGLNNLSAAQALAQANAALAAYDPPTKAEMDAGHALLATATALATVDTVADAIKVKTDLITTNTSVSVNSALNAGALTIYAGETLATTFTGLTIPSNWKYIDLALKSVATDTDAQSIVWIRATNPAAGTDGLQRLNGATATAAQGSLTVNQAAGTVAAWLADDATTQLTATTCVYGLKVIESDGDSSRLCADGTCTISNMVVKALT